LTHKLQQVGNSNNQALLFLVSWVGFGRSDNSWEPLSSFEDFREPDSIVRQYIAQHWLEVMPEVQQALHGGAQVGEGEDVTHPVSRVSPSTPSVTVPASPSTPAHGSRSSSGLNQDSSATEHRPRPRGHHFENYRVPPWHDSLEVHLQETGESRPLKVQRSCSARKLALSYDTVDDIETSTGLHTWQHAQ
jgi:hypothetical protein